MERIKNTLFTARSYNVYVFCFLFNSAFNNNYYFVLEKL